MEQKRRQITASTPQPQRPGPPTAPYPTDLSYNPFKTDRQVDFRVDATKALIHQSQLPESVKASRMQARTQQPSPQQEEQHTPVFDQSKQHQLLFDDPRLQKLESSPYRQRLYFKGKPKYGMNHIRSPSVTNGQGSLFAQQKPQQQSSVTSPMFPPAEYFNNLKNSQIRQTYQAEKPVKQLSPARLTPQTHLPPATPMNNASTTDDYSTLQPKSLLTTRGIRFYNKVVEDFQNKFYLQKTRPTSIKKKAEEMYDVNIQLKHQINQLKEQVTLQKTQNKLLNNELEKQNQLMAQILGQTVVTEEGIPHIVIEETTIKQSELVNNLKRELDKALKSLAAKDVEIKQINKMSKVTKYRELEEECKAYMHESMRQNRLLKKFLFKAGLARSPALFDSIDEAAKSQEEAAQPEWQEKLGFFKNQNEKLKEEVKTLKQRYDIQANQSKQLIEQNKQLQIQLEARPAMVDESKQENKYKKLADEQKALIEGLKEQVASLIKEKEASKKDREALSLKISELEQSLAERKVAEASAEQVLKKEIQALEEKLASSQLMLSNVTLAQNSLQATIERLREEAAQLEGQLAQQKSKKKELKEQVKLGSAKDSEKASAMQERVQSMQVEIRGLKDSHSLELKSLKDAFDKEGASLKDQMQTMQQAASIEATKHKEEVDSLQTKLSDLTAQNTKLLQEIERLKGEKPKTEVIRDDEEIEKLKADLVQALENIRRYRELTETKEQEITALKSTHEHAISNLRADLKEKQEEVEDLRKAIRDLEAELVRVKENPIVKEVEVFKMADKPLESEPADDQYEELTQQLRDYAQQNEDLQSQLEQRDQQVGELNLQVAALTKELQEKDKDIEQLQEELIEARESSAGGDQEMLQKLQDLMVSLQLKDQDMKKQGELLDHLVQEKEEFEKQLEEARMEVGAKEAEASTIRTYFDKSEADKDKLQEELTQLRKAHTKAQEELAKLQQESGQFAKDFPAMQKELEQLRKEKEGLNLSLDSERHSHLIDVQLRFKRCLEILQINTEEGLANFLKGASESEDLEEYLAMKFNVTKAESSLFQRRVLCLQAPYSKQQLIQRFIQNVGKDVTLIDKDQIAKHYTRLVANILQQQPSVDEFLKVNGFDKVKIMHYYLVEKIVSRLVPEATMHQLTTHLLNQSRNFYQIEVKVLKEQLLKHLDAAKTLPKEKPPSKSDPKPVAEEEDQYEYFEEDDDLDEEEKLMMEDERAIFNSAVDKLKSTNKVPSADPSMTIQLSKNQLNMSAASIREPRQQQPSAQKVDSPQLAQFGKFLTTKKMNLRQFLRVYHVGPQELPSLDKEVEVLKFEEFVAFTKQQNIFSEADLEKYAPFSSRPVEETLEGMLKNKIHDVSKPIQTKVIELGKLCENLSPCGYQDYKRPISRKNFDFNTLDIKSIRIMNRLAQHVYQEVEKFTLHNKINGQLSREQKRTLLGQIMESIFKDSLKRVNVHTQAKEESVYLINNEDFFKKLVLIGVRKSSKLHENLNQFLTVDNQYQYLILFKKLIKTVEVFHENGLFNQIGLRRSRLDQSANASPNKVKINAKPESQQQQKRPHQQQKPQEQIAPKAVTLQKPKEEVKKAPQKKPTAEEEEYEYGYEYGEEASPTPKQATAKKEAPKLKTPQQEPQKKQLSPQQEEYDNGYEYGEEEQSPSPKQMIAPRPQQQQPPQMRPQQFSNLPMPGMLPQPFAMQQQQQRPTSYQPFSFTQPHMPQPTQAVPFNWSEPPKMSPINPPPPTQQKPQRNLDVRKQPSNKEDEYGEEYYEYDEEVQRK